MDDIDQKIDALRERQRAWVWTIENNPRLGFLRRDLRREIELAEDEIARLYAEKKA